MDWVLGVVRSPTVHAALLASCIAGGLSLSRAPHPGGAEGRWAYEQLACEEALAHLKDCCPSLDDVGCRHFEREETSGCETCSWGATPDISIDEGDTYRRLSCDEVRAEGICEAVDARDRSWDNCSDEDAYY